LSLAKNQLRMAYAYISRSLFKSDRLMFAMHLAHGMFPKKIPDNVKKCFVSVVFLIKINLGMGTFYWFSSCRC
jgi:dynein heavy chain 2